MDFTFRSLGEIETKDLESLVQSTDDYGQGQIERLITRQNHIVHAFDRLLEGLYQDGNLSSDTIRSIVLSFTYVDDDSDIVVSFDN